MSLAQERTDVGLPAFNPPALNAAQQRIVDSLREEGIAVARYEDLLGEPTFQELEADIAPFVYETEERARNADSAPQTKDEFIVRRFLSKEADAPKPRFSLDDVWLRVGASERVLDVVDSYRGRWTKLYYVDNWFTVPYPGADQRIASQRWHRDPEEEHVVKVFLYLSDVDEEAGPFEYIQGSTTGGRYGDFFPWSEGDRHPPENELDRAVAPGDRLTLTGPAGTMLFCDTGGFHRGGFARAKPRILAAWSYVSSAGKVHRYEVDFEGREAELPARVRAALV
jgi:ectoine hydroxylase-related dioxygenase (phytanoyl-CoA dioxygenase family)